MSDPQGDLTVDEAVERLTRPGSLFALTTAVVGGVEYRVFEHAPRNLARWYALSELHDDATFLVYEDERLTFREVRRAAANLAHQLSVELGVEKGDRVALCMRNYPEWCITYMAVTSIGGVVVPLNGWWLGPELAYGIRDSGARLVVVDGERLERLVPELPELDVQLLVTRHEGALPPRALPLAPCLEGGYALPEVDVAPDDDATILYTSGSTGHPKGVVSTHRAVISSLMSWQFVLFVGAMREMPVVQKPIEAWVAEGAAALGRLPFAAPQSSMLATVPFFHVTGCNVIFLPAFRSGRKLVLMRKWDPEQALMLIEREKITDFTGVPSMSWDLINSPDFEKRDTSTLRSLGGGGAARPPEHVRRMSEKASDARPGTGWGMTETNSIGAVISGPDYVARPSSVGRAMVPLVDVDVVDEAGNVVGTGEEGELRIKSAANMRCYWNQAQATAETLTDGWVHTGDLGRIDEEGFVFITGRAKDIVIRGGENISCPEVEHALYEHPAVFEAAVYGVPHERLGEELAATVMLAAGAEVSVEELQAHVADRLARFKVPTRIHIQSEQLPRIASGKIDKRAIKQAAAP